MLSKETTLKRGLNALFLIKKLLLELFEKFEQLPFFYMSTINSLYSRLAAVDIEKSAIDAVTDTKDEYRDLNKAQMAKGLNSDGSIIGIYASAQYAAFKQAIGSQAPYGIVDLKLSQAFYNGIKTDVSGLNIITNSSDIKNAKLVEDYGANIFGLTNDSKATYLQDLRPVFVSKIDLALNSSV